MAFSGFDMQSQPQSGADSFFRRLNNLPHVIRACEAIEKGEYMDLSTLPSQVAIRQQKAKALERERLYQERMSKRKSEGAPIARTMDELLSNLDKDPRVVLARQNLVSGKFDSVFSQPTIHVFEDMGSGPPSNINFVVCPLESFPEGYFIPAVVSGYFDAYFNPVGDGHCGFRCISSAAVGDEGDWHNMRTQLLVEITKPVYRNIYEVALIDPFSRISCSPNTGFVGLQNWMIGEDLFGYATIFNWAICCISVSYHSVTSAIQWTGSATYLPLRAPSGVQGPYGVMWILHTGDHYIRVCFEGDVPMPPIHFLWHINRHDAIVDWDLLYASNIERWHSAFGFNTGFVDLSDDDG